MANDGKSNRLNYVMEMLGVRANALARMSGADHSLITKWRRGERRLTFTSKNLLEISEALLEIDKEGELMALIEPYKQPGEAPADTLRQYLIGHDLPALPPRTAPAERVTSGEYTVQHRVYLGQKGLRSATIAMLDYIMALPPGREIVAVCHGNYNWVVKNMSYVAMLIDRLRNAFSRGATLTVINRKGYALTDVAAFAVPWLAAHMQGFIRSRYYEGELPEGERIVASIRDYWSLRAHEDKEVEDGLFAAMFTDPLDIRQDVRTCDEYYGKSKSLSQYNFFTAPEGTGEDVKLWSHPDKLPLWEGGINPDGSFNTVQRTPCLGILSLEELRGITGAGELAFPSYLFSSGGELSPGPHKLILCLEDVRKSLTQSTPSGVLGDLMQKPVSIPKDLSATLMKRVLALMEERSDFEVALVPRVAFKKMQLEMICWQDSATVGWLQDHSQSVYTNDEVVSGSLYGSVDYLWDRLLAGWKRQDRLRRQIRKWLSGKELDVKLEDSAIVRGWDIYPKNMEAPK